MTSAQPKDTDGMLQEWGARLFYAPLKGKKTSDSGLLAQAVLATRASRAPSRPPMRAQIRATLAARGPQVMVKITGGGRGMKPIQAHMRYISRLGKEQAGGPGQSFELEDENGNLYAGAEGIYELARDWQVAGAYIDDTSHRREAHNIILSMPEGTPPEAVKEAARAFAQEAFEGYKWVMVLHTDTKSPHVHLAVRAQRYDGRRLNPGRADLHRWRETFAARLQDQGINALATKARTRGIDRSPQTLWHQKDPQRVRKPRRELRQGVGHELSKAQALLAWREIEAALKQSSQADDRELAKDVARFIAQAFTAPPKTNKRRTEQQRDAQRAAYQRNYGQNPRPNYDNPDPIRARASPRGAATHQPDTAAPQTRRPPQPVAGLRKLSGIPVVQDRSGSHVLLQPNAQHRVEQRSGPDHDVRRPGTSTEPDANRVDGRADRSGPEAPGPDKSGPKRDRTRGR